MPLLEIRDLHKVYGTGPHRVHAVRGIDLDIDRNETVALVGESGCGKSSSARIVVGLAARTGGSVRFDGVDLTEATRRASFRRRVQMVFQHPEQSLNPRYRVEQTLREPLVLLGVATGSEADARIDEALRTVGLGPQYRRRRPRELSGGQQQRVAIARALICEPDLVVLDEPTASLDQSVRSRILGLLQQVQAERGVGYLLISHDLTTVRRIADRVAVMYLGRIVELADNRTLFAAPQHPYTKALLSAVPDIDPARRRQRIPLSGETPSPSSLPPGCAFADRCPLVRQRCRTDDGLRLEPYADDHLVECFEVPTRQGAVP